MFFVSSEVKGQREDERETDKEIGRERLDEGQVPKEMTAFRQRQRIRSRGAFERKPIFPLDCFTLAGGKDTC